MANTNLRKRHHVVYKMIAEAVLNKEELRELSKFRIGMAIGIVLGYMMVALVYMATGRILG